MRAGICKHFNGIQNGKCEAGVTYNQFKRENASFLNTLPCMERNLGYGCVCDKREAPTLAELEADELEVEQAMGNVLEIDRMIGEGKKSGEFPCHVCIGGTVRFVYRGSLAAQAICDSCNWSAIS